jgi:hypothetical protein
MNTIIEVLPTAFTTTIGSVLALTLLGWLYYKLKTHK